MIKIAELINNKTICGEFDGTEINQWKNVLVIHVSQTKQSQANIGLNPLLIFGDFSQNIKIDEGNIVYTYNPDDSFKQAYNQQVTRIKSQRSGLILP